MKASNYKQMRAGQEAGVSPTSAFPSSPPCICAIECGRYMCVNRDRRQHVHHDEPKCPRHGRSNGAEQ